jgi:Tfp pilus assembly protein PilZ
MANTNVNDKRKNERIQLSLNVSYRLKDERNYSEVLSCTNISGGGLGVQTTDNLHSGDLLEIRISKNQEVYSINARGRVVWSKELKSGMYHVGIEFTKLEDDYKFIEFICTEMLNHSSKNAK